MLIMLLIIAPLSFVLSSYRLLQCYQLGGYRQRELRYALLRKKFVPLIIPFAAALAAISFFFIYYYIALAAVPLAAALSVIAHRKSKVKLVFTPRLVRFLCVYLLLSPLLIFGFLLAHAITFPLEKRCNNKKILATTKPLRESNIIKIAITGSYGKTTAKNILAHILSTQYSVATTRENYNTPIGLAKSVPVALPQIFIAEMGARYRGDIAELCALYRPNVAFITAIGSQHLQTLGSIENIRAEKLSLAQYVTNNGGTAYLPKDYEIKNLTLNERGTCFTVTVKGKTLDLTTPLLGEHIPNVIARCCELALDLGVTEQNLKKSVSTLKAVANRQELLYNGNDIIIDDSYNASEQSAIASLKLLPLFANRVKIVVTPGVVEGGEMQYEVNCRVGKVAGECADYAIFIGANANALKQGCVGATVITVATLSAAVEELKNIKGERVTLFISDLPDDY